MCVMVCGDWLWLVVEQEGHRCGGSVCDGRYVVLRHVSAQWWDVIVHHQVCHTDPHTHTHLLTGEICLLSVYRISLLCAFRDVAAALDRKQRFGFDEMIYVVRTVMVWNHRCIMWLLHLLHLLLVPSLRQIRVRPSTSSSSFTSCQPWDTSGQRGTHTHTHTHSVPTYQMCIFN